MHERAVANPTLIALGAFSGSMLTTGLLAMSGQSAGNLVWMVIGAFALTFGVAMLALHFRRLWIQSLFLVIVLAPVLTGAALRFTDTFFAGDTAFNASANRRALTDFQKLHGIGPITTELGITGIDSALVSEGEELFRRNCSSCHKLNERLVGPALRDVANRRTPEYMMNMILNPAEMVQRHPEARKLLAKHLTVMTYQGVTRDQARALVEFLRYSADNAETAPLKDRQAPDPR